MSTKTLRAALANSVVNAGLGLNVYEYDTPNPAVPCLIIGRPQRYQFHATYGASRQVDIPVRVAISVTPGEQQAQEELEDLVDALVRPLERSGHQVSVQDTGPIEVGQLGNVEALSVVLNLTCQL